MYGDLLTHHSSCLSGWIQKSPGLAFQVLKAFELPPSCKDFLAQITMYLHPEKGQGGHSGGLPPAGQQDLDKLLEANAEAWLLAHISELQMLSDIELHLKVEPCRSSAVSLVVMLAARSYFAGKMIRAPAACA